MSQNLDIDECLKDKSSNLFESYPEFVELVALVHKYGEFLSLTPFSYSDLAMALKKEENALNSYDPSQGFPSALHSALLENLIAEILLFFSTRFDSSNIYKKLNGLIISINRWCMPKFNARLLFPSQPKLNEIEEDESDDDSNNPQSREQSANISNQNSDKYQSSDKVYKKKRMPDFLNLSTIDKLKLLCFLIDAQLACAHDADQLDEIFSVDEQRIVPIGNDNSGRKFWYFCDTWLFTEEENLFNVEEEEEKVQDLLKDAVESREKFIKKVGTKKNNKNDIRRYIKNKSNKEVRSLTIEKPKGTFNQRILDEANKNLCTTSRFRVICKNSDHLSNLIKAYMQRSNNRSNFIKKLEECLHCIQAIEKENIEKLEREALLRQSSRIAILAEKRRQKVEENRRKALELAKLKKEEDEQKRLTESAIKLCEQSREQRLMQRQQRIQEQLDQKELVEAGIILPSSRSSYKDDLSSIGSSTEENDYRKSCKPVKKIPRLPAYDWWNPGFYGSSVNGFDKIRNALNLTRMDNSDTSEDSFMQTSRKWAPVHPASLLGFKTPGDDEDYEEDDN
uniref:DDT domain-containing protein n=1 Tax=Meloidogyne hapla TaxID=6305 RepID=A0A1I8BAH2_MELHA